MCMHMYINNIKGQMDTYQTILESSERIKKDFDILLYIKFISVFLGYFTKRKYLFLY